MYLGHWIMLFLKHLRDFEKALALIRKNALEISLTYLQKESLVFRQSVTTKLL